MKRLHNHLSLVSLVLHASNFLGTASLSFNSRKCSVAASTSCHRGLTSTASKLMHPRADTADTQQFIETSSCWLCLTGHINVRPTWLNSVYPRGILTSPHYPARACASKGLCDRYPARACASKGLCDRSWCLLYIYIYICKTFFYLSKYSLSEVYFNTDRLLIEFNGLWYSLAARHVFVAIANPDSLSFG